MAILGIHHVTAIATDPQTNVDFYAGTLGLRLVKRTVNFDDPGAYHFYYGDETGRPGTILTFFPWPMARRGQRGTGQATVTSFSVPEGSLGWWRERFAAHGVVAGDPEERFEEDAMVVLDPDGLMLELVAHAGVADVAPWAGAAVPERHAIRGFRSVTLAVQGYEKTAALLTGTLGFEPAGERRNRFRFRVGAGAAAADASGGPSGTAPGTLVDVVCSPDVAPGRVAAGTVHHVAWRVAGDAEQARWRAALAGEGLDVTPVLDRQYFHSIYFREPGGVLFEIATDSPGFALDEPVASLGEALKLPPWLEPHRERIAGVLPPITLPKPDGGEGAA
ncbi:MAG TPA: ring-cleaving dioxygenase [Thermoanaerobaculia bacterium]|nr:ring-cleaving dioxygenase [Thermoanaerobaculia bacterium]